MDFEPSDRTAARALVGDRLLAYTLAADELAVDEHFADSGALTVDQSAALKIVMTIAVNALTQGRERSIPPQLLLDPLVGAVDDQGTSLVNALRTSCGGNMPNVDDADDVQAAIGYLARDTFPAFLVPRSRDPWLGPSIHLGAAAFQHPAAKRFEEAASRDPDLRQLVPFGTETQGRTGAYVASSGRGGSLQLALLANTVLQDAYHRLALRGRHDVSAFVSQAQEHVNLLRALARGETVMVPALVVFTYIRLPDGAAIRTPWGQLRELRETESELAPPDLSGRLTHTDSSGVRVEVNYAGDVVLETEIPLRIGLKSSIDDQADLTAIATAGPDLTHASSLLSLAITLASGERPYAFAIPTWRVIFDPLAHGPMLSWRGGERVRGALGASPRRLKSEELADVEAWSSRVADAHSSGIDVAVRRIQTAIADRTDAVDSLIDIVIAWENLLGSSRGESTLRLSASLAILLANDPASRREIKKQVSRVYGMRSKVVHGSSRGDPSSTHEEVLGAIDLTVAALRALYDERPDLIGLPSSGDRSMALILGDDTPR